MNAIDPVRPKIDDRYWFTFSETLVSKAQDTRDQVAGKLQNLVIWLWGIYTASAAVGFALSGKELSFWPTFLIAAASASLIAVYWGTVWVQVPVLVEFDPRSPTEIKDAYKGSVETKDCRLKITLFLSFVASVMVSLALIIASVSKAEKTTAPAFVASLHSKNSSRLLAVTGMVGPTKAVTVQVRPMAQGEKPAESQSFIFVPTDKGLLQTSIQLDPGVTEVEVTLEWEDPVGMKIQLSKKIREEKKAKAPS